MVRMPDGDNKGGMWVTLTATFGETTGIPSTTLSHNEGLLSQIKTGLVARAIRRPRLPAPKITIGTETVIAPQRFMDAGMWFSGFVSAEGTQGHYCKLTLFCQAL